MIPYSCQAIAEEDVETVVEVLRSEFLTQGPVVPKFEEAVSRYVGVKHAAAVNSATSALHIACLALGLGPGDWLWTSPNTFVASANCGLYCGAKIDFVDIDPRTYNLCPKALDAKLQNAAQAGHLPKIVVAVHFAGQSCDMKAIHALSQQYGFRIIEDASHALGAEYLSGKVGSCEYSDITVFSFHAVKMITTGEGGMAVTNATDLAEEMALLRSHGVTRDRALMQEPTVQSPWYYQQTCLGFNYRMTDIHAALGLSQLNRLSEFVNSRTEKALHYNECLEHTLVTPFSESSGASSWHLYVVQVEGRDRIYQAMLDANIGVNVHYYPVHLQAYYQRMGFSKGDCPVAEKYAKSALTLPLYPGLVAEQQQHVVDTLKRSVA